MLEVQVNRSDCLQSGEQVQIVYTATNNDKRPAVLESRDTPVLDIAIEKPGNPRFLASWSEANPDRIAHRVEWQPGESHVITMTWTAPQEKFLPGEVVYALGLLSVDSKFKKSAGIDVCLGSRLEGR